jgi:ribosomal protein S18 acetylase RimI-like enzyme/DNA-binding transcriptional ArsR family regulator
VEFVNELGLVALGSRLRGISERLYSIADEVYAAQGLAIQGRWFPLLRLLHDRGPRTVGEIAEAIGQTHSAVSQLADRLTRDGWLRAVVDRADRRLRRLSLTAKADAALRDAKPIWRAIQDVLDTHCRAAGIDVLGTLGAFGAVLEAPLADEIARRALALRADAVQVVPFRSELREHFYRLNADWLRRYFYLEEIDHRVLSHPEEEIIAPGGAIFFALSGDNVVGTCALKLDADGVYELSKMAVDPAAQGLGIGRRLIDATIAEFGRRKGRTLFLESNSRLTPAVRLYESAGFEHQPTTKPDSHYQRSDVYMIWRRPVAAKAAKAVPVKKAPPASTRRVRAKQGA